MEQIVGVKELIEMSMMAGTAVAGLASIIGVYYNLKSKGEKTETKLSDYISLDVKQQDEFKKEVNERFLHGKNAKKATVIYLEEKIERAKKEFNEREDKIYARINEVRDEQKEEHKKLYNKLEELSTDTKTANIALARIEGYLGNNKKED